MHHLCIHINQKGNLTFSVVDSPYYEDIWIDLRTHKFCGSTFQILLQAFSSLYYNNISDVIRYYEKFPMEKYFTVNISKAPQSLIIPNKHCQKVSFCIWKFKAPIQKQIHLTITMIFKGITTTECMYGGIAVFDGVKPVVNICKDYGPRITSRNVYSNKSTLFVSAYTYQPFSWLQGNIKINITACKPIIINICQIKYFCLSLSCEGNYCYMCHHLLNFTKSGLVFKIDKLGKLIYSLELGRCIVIQVANDFPIYTEPKYIHSIFAISCMANLYQELIPKTNRLIQYEILGVCAAPKINCI